MEKPPPQKPMFSTLIASKPQRERKGVWLVITAIHIVVIAVLWVTGGARALRESVTEYVTPILVREDDVEIVPLDLPEPQPEPPSVEAAPPARPAPAPAPARRDDRPATTPGTSEPGGDALIAPASVPTGIPPVNAGEGVRSFRERLMGAAPGNPILNAPLDGNPPAVGVEAARLRIAASVSAINDSILAEQAYATRSRDWTRTDKDGKKWGISPGKIHLGSFTIPLNNNGEDLFRPPPGRRDEIASAIRTWHDIERQAARADVKDSFEERVKEIRKRKDAERKAARPITN